MSKKEVLGGARGFERYDHRCRLCVVKFSRRDFVNLVDEDGVISH